MIFGQYPVIKNRGRKKEFGKTPLGLDMFLRRNIPLDVRSLVLLRASQRCGNAAALTLRCRTQSLNAQGKSAVTLTQSAQQGEPSPPFSLSYESAHPQVINAVIDQLNASGRGWGRPVTCDTQPVRSIVGISKSQLC